MSLSKATLKMVKDDRGVEHPMAECVLLRDPFPVFLAHELGDGVADHLFSNDKVRDELKTITLDPYVPQQAITVRETPDSEGVVTLRHVDILTLTCAACQDEDTGERWIKASVRIRFGLAEREHRDFLVRAFGMQLCWSFAVEQRPLPLEAETPEQTEARARVKEAGARLAESTPKGSSVTIEVPGLSPVTLDRSDGKRLRQDARDIRAGLA
jgi:hypothetical protein